MNIRILLAEDHEIVRQGLRELLRLQSGISVVGEAEDGQAAVQLAKECLPDMVIMDVSMPKLNGADATRAITSANPQTKVLALSMHGDASFVAEMFKAGASGYLLKGRGVEELMQAIHAVAAGEVFISPQVAGTVVRGLVRQGGQDASAFVSLTQKEREVLQLLAEGLSTKQIALQLGLSAKTVEARRGQIMDKLKLHSIAELTKYAIREGITSLD